MNEAKLKTILCGDLQAAKFICDNFQDIQIIHNKTDIQLHKDKEFLESCNFDY